MANNASISMRGQILKGVYTSEASGHTSPEHQYDNEEFIVGGVYARFLRISSFLGLAPLRFKPRGDAYNVSISIPMCIYSYILMTGLVALASLYSVRSDCGTSMPSVVSRVVTYSGLAHCFSAGVGVYGAPCRMRKLINSLSTIALVDQSIDAKYSPAMERRVCRYLAIFFFFITFVSVADSIFTLVQYEKMFFECSDNILSLRATFCVSFCLNFILKMQFAFTAMSVRARFAAVNKVLDLTAKHLAVPYVENPESPHIMNVCARRLAPAGLHSKTVLVRKSVTGQRHLAVPLSDAVQRVAFHHDLLCDVVDDVTNSYGVFLNFDLISTVFNITSNLYFSLMEIYKDENEKNNAFLIVTCLWIILNLLELFMSMEPGHYTIQESKKTEGIVSRMISESPSQGALASRLKAFSRQLVLRRAGYKPMGFFTLNRSLIASIIGVVATHLVILLQFQ